MDDFTFPTAAAAAEPADPLCLHHPHRLPFPLFAASPLLFPSSPKANAAAAVAVAVAPVVVSRSVDDMKEQEPTSDATERRAEGEGELVSGAGAGAADEDKMDMLWENFNEELEALRRAGSCSKAPAGGGAAAGGVELTSDTESEPARLGHGFAPMLRPSSRAGGTGQYRRTSWVLLMRIFRRLFVVEKTISTARQQARAQ